MPGDVPVTNRAGWPLVSLREVTAKIGSGATPRGGADAYLPDRVHFALVRSQNVFDRHFDRAGLAFISDEQADSLRGVRLQAGDILLNITGDGVTFGRACMVPDDVLPACVNQHVSIVRVEPTRADPGYVLSFLTHPCAKPYIESFSAGGSRRAITKGHIESFRLPLPPLPEQRAIAHILGTLDDKIEANRRLGETLEAMARVIFTSWFVDFDPVRAKVSGEAPDAICRRLRLTPDLLALFPDRFQDSELGEIPEGWEASTLAEQAERCGGVIQTGPFGSQLHASDYLSGGVPVVMPQDMQNRRVSTARVARVAEKDASRLSRHRLQPGDVVYSRRGDVERHAVITVREAGWLCGTGCLLVRLGLAWPSPTYLSLALDQPLTRDWISRHAVGATMPNLNTAILGNVPILLPSDSLIRTFDASVSVLARERNTLDLEGESLASLRDTLLPKLVSGELRVAIDEPASINGQEETSC